MSFLNKIDCRLEGRGIRLFCLMQKYVDLKSLGAKLQIVSAFSVEHVKGFIYIEAEKQSDINEVHLTSFLCSVICTIKCMYIFLYIYCMLVIVHLSDYLNFLLNTGM